jgi:hypothetical protein
MLGIDTRALVFLNVVTPRELAAKCFAVARSELAFLHVAVHDRGGTNMCALLERALELDTLVKSTICLCTTGIVRRTGSALRTDIQTIVRSVVDGTIVCTIALDASGADL